MTWVGDENGGNLWVISTLSQGMDAQLQLTKTPYNQSVIFLLLKKEKLCFSFAEPDFGSDESDPTRWVNYL